MKKWFYLFFIMFLFAGCCYARVTSAQNSDFDLVLQSNLSYKFQQPANARIAYSITYDGKVGDLKILQSGGEEFDNAIIAAFANIKSAENDTVNNAIKTKKYIGNEISRAIVNLYEKKSISKGDVDKMIINKKHFYVADIPIQNVIQDNSDIAGKNNEVLNKYIKTIDDEADLINMSLNPWSSFKTKTINTYVRLNREGKVVDAIILQSCGSDAYDKYYLEKLKSHTFTIPDVSIPDRDLQFIFTAKPLKQSKYEALNSYRRSVERIIYYATPYSKAIKPTTIALEVTILKNGNLKSVKLLENTYSDSYDEQLMKAYKKLAFKILPKEINLDEITFVVRVRKNVKYYPQIDDRNYTSWAIFD